jgi:hypothetical protein
MVKAALVTLGLAGAGYAADQAAPPPPADMAQTVNTQRAGEGRKLTPEEFEHQRETLRPEQMLELGLKYQQEMAVALEHADTVRIAAYQSRDVIRMTCIDDKLGQMKEVIKIATPRMLDPKREYDPLLLRQHFTIVQQARERVSELAVEVDSCIGDTIDSVAYGRINREAPPTDNVFDPTRPPEPTQVVDRPPEASPFQ